MCCNHERHPNHLQRRYFLQYILAGMTVAMLPGGNALAAGFSPPGQLQAGRSVFRVSGRAWVNGNRVDANTRIGPNDTVKTSHDGELVFVVGNHAMLLRGGSHLVMQAKEESTEAAPVIGLLQLFSGKLLSASRNKGMRIHTPAATIGVRGTGVYLEADPDETLFCTCYGEVDIEASHDPASKDSVQAVHHDRPLVILKEGQPGQSIHSAKDPQYVKPGAARLKHSDEELTMIEALVGRTPPFAPQK
jgi:hypothetical protein